MTLKEPVAPLLVVALEGALPRPRHQEGRGQAKYANDVRPTDLIDAPPPRRRRRRRLASKALAA